EVELKEQAQEGTEVVVPVVIKPQDRIKPSSSGGLPLGFDVCRLW
ncbi:hypothetical protein A2U01_0058572, partial [Trifolium medium]|nr:hypothetical protein [Trifolium medium]